MPGRRRYCLVITKDKDRSTESARTFSVSLRRLVVVGSFLFALPMLMGIGAGWSGQSEMDALRASNQDLRVENINYRVATGQLTTQIQSLEDVIDELGARASMGPELLKAMQSLPAVVKSKAAGGSSATLRPT